MKDDNDILYLSNDMIALERQTEYKYQIMPCEKDDEPMVIDVLEYINLRKMANPKYDIYINGYRTMNNQCKELVPDRFLYIIDLIDHYIVSRLGRNKK